MTVRFNPPQLESARLSELLLRLAAELAPNGVNGELRVLRTFPLEPMRLVWIREGKKPASMDLPNDWLYTEIPEKEVRDRLRELVGRAGKG
jgi:hypothetical protein